MDKLNSTRTALRLGVCSDCSSRAAVVDGAPPSGSRACESGCEIFYYLPRLASMVRRFGGEPPCGYESAVLNLPCRQCGEPVWHAEHCESCHGHRPIEQYVAKALATIERIETGDDTQC